MGGLRTLSFSFTRNSSSGYFSSSTLKQTKLIYVYKQHLLLGLKLCKRCVPLLLRASSKPVLESCDFVRVQLQILRICCTEPWERELSVKKKSIMEANTTEHGWQCAHFLKKALIMLMFVGIAFMFFASSRRYWITMHWRATLHICSSWNTRLREICVCPWNVVDRAHDTLLSMAKFSASIVK